LNSSYYSLSQKISDLKAAINLLGLREIRNLALTVFVSRFYEGGTAHGAYKRENLWAHSVGVAVALFVHLPAIIVFGRLGLLPFGPGGDDSGGTEVIMLGVVTLPSCLFYGFIGWLLAKAMKRKDGF